MANIYQQLRVAKATFDPTANSGERGTGTHGLGVFIPDNAIILDVFYDVITVFTSTAGGTDKSVIGIEIEGANDVVDGLAIENALDIWDAGIHKTIVGAPTLSAFNATNNPTAVEYASHKTATRAVTIIKTTAAKEIDVVVETQALTGGKFHVYVVYFVSE